MAFFNFRRGSSNPASAAGPAAQPESVEAMRKRAKHRLIGAVVLVLIGVVGFPLLFDTQPRPIAVDIPIEIPGKNSVKPLTLPAPSATTAATPSATPEPAPADKVAAASSLSAKEEIVTAKPEKAQKPQDAQEGPAPSVIKDEAKPAPKPETKTEPAAEPKAVEKPLPKPPAKVETKPPARPAEAVDDGARARALLNATAQPQKTAKTPVVESGSRMVVQVGAFADASKADEARLRLEKAGLRTYTQVTDTKEGKRTRVRVGPFASKAEADQAAAKIKLLGLPAAVLTL